MVFASQELLFTWTRTTTAPFARTFSLKAPHPSYPRLTPARRHQMLLTWPYAHLLINHFPVVLSVSALALTILALVLGGRGLWLTAMGALTAAGIFVYPVYFTGNKADQALNDPWYIHSGVIDSHKDAATFTLWVVLAVGVFAA